MGLIEMVKAGMMSTFKRSRTFRCILFKQDHLLKEDNFKIARPPASMKSVLQSSSIDGNVWVEFATKNILWHRTSPVTVPYILDSQFTGWFVGLTVCTL